MTKSNQTNSKSTSTTMVTITTNSILVGHRDPFKPALQLQTPKPTTAAVAASLLMDTPDISNNKDNKNDDDDNQALVDSSLDDPNEARYWMHQYGWGTHTYNRSLAKYAHPRKLVMNPSDGTAMVHAIVWGPQSTAQGKSAPLAVVGGPRVYLFGTNAISSFARHLAKPRTANDSNSKSDEVITKSVTADRQIQTGGQLSLCAAFRNDGRLLAVGTHAGEVRICDVTMRATLTTFVSPTKLPIRTVEWFRNGQWIASGGDDAIVRVWNLASGIVATSSNSQQPKQKQQQQLLMQLGGHGDAVRTVVVWQKQAHQRLPLSSDQQQDAPDNIITLNKKLWSQLVISGSYDHTIRIWTVWHPDHDHVVGDDRDEPTHKKLPPSLLTSPTTPAGCNTAEKEDNKDYLQKKKNLLQNNNKNNNNNNNNNNGTLVHHDPKAIINLNDKIDQNGRCLKVLHHGAPVEALITMPSTSSDTPVWIISAGGITLKVWNIFTGDCVCTLTTQHRKTITTVMPIMRASSSQNSNNNNINNNGWRIVTGSLDGCIRIHQFYTSTGTLHHIHGIQIGNGQDPITSMACCNNAQLADRIAIGTATGKVLVRQRASISPSPHQLALGKKRPARAGTYAYFNRGMNTAYSGIGGDNATTTHLATTTSANDYLQAPVTKKKRSHAKLHKYDQCLKQFRYGDALDEALATRIPSVVVAVLEELGKRRGLVIALSNRNEKALEPILSFLIRYLTRPRFTHVLMGVAHSLIDIYGTVAGESEAVTDLFRKLKEEVQRECQIQKSLTILVGQLDGILEQPVEDDDYD